MTDSSYGGLVIVIVPSFTWLSNIPFDAASQNSSQDLCWLFAGLWDYDTLMWDHLCCFGESTHVQLLVILPNYVS